MRVYRNFKQKNYYKLIFVVNFIQNKCYIIIVIKNQKPVSQIYKLNIFKLRVIVVGRQFKINSPFRDKIEVHGALFANKRHSFEISILSSRYSNDDIVLAAMFGARSCWRLFIIDRVVLRSSFKLSIDTIIQIVIVKLYKNSRNSMKNMKKRSKMLNIQKH